MYYKRYHFIAWRYISRALALAAIILATGSCHSIRHDELPEEWQAESHPHTSDCADISGTYRDQSIEETSDCYRGRDDRVHKCTTSLSRALLGKRVDAQPTHVEIQQPKISELTIRLWSDDELLEEFILSSAQEEFSCKNEGIRVNWRDTVVIAPPFASIFDYEYGTFQRTVDGSLVMRRSDNNVWLMWGFIPWLTDVGSSWIKWPSYDEDSQEAENKGDGHPTINSE